MKNSTTALILVTILTVYNLFVNKAEIFLGLCIFASAFLILKQLEKSNKK